MKHLILLFSIVAVLGSPAFGQLTPGTSSSTPSGIVTVSAKSANFTALTSERGTIFDVTTGGANMTATLPAAATAGNGWYCFVRKADTGIGLVLTSPTTLPAAVSAQVQNALVLVWSDGTSWYQKVHLGNVDAAGAVTIAAGGTNQNINLNTTGTGSFISSSGNGIQRFNASAGGSTLALGGTDGQGALLVGTSASGTTGASFISNTKIYTTGSLHFATVLGNGTSSGDTTLARNAAGIVEINNGTAGTFRDLKLRQLLPDSTITAAGVTGAQTINKGAGTINFAAGGALTIPVTNALVLTTTQIILTRQNNDATATVVSVNNKVAGAFNIVINAAATAELPVYWELRNQN